MLGWGRTGAIWLHGTEFDLLKGLMGFETDELVPCIGVVEIIEGGVFRLTLERVKELLFLVQGEGVTSLSTPALQDLGVVLADFSASDGSPSLAVSNFSTRFSSCVY